MIEEIREHFEKEYPREGCGVIGIVNNEKKWFPCKNIAEAYQNFIMCPEDWFKLRTTVEIHAIVHSHPDESNEASQHDIDCCNIMGIPYYIFSYPEMELNILKPKEQFTSVFSEKKV